MAEANFDGLVGPTHNYAGLSHGNRASTGNRGLVSNPKKAALQGLAKMRFVASLGLPQGVLPPHERPHGPTMRQLGYGADARLAVEQVPVELLRVVSSAASMWTANAATVSPSADTNDGRVHFTPANLLANAHRAIEGPQTYRTLKRIFNDDQRFCVNEPLPSTLLFADEGAANHTRLHWGSGETDGRVEAVELFVYGRMEPSQ
ncbi:MAG: N-succinylarginine dihydrolase [Acidimicrobiales bacterium]